MSGNTSQVCQAQSILDTEFFRAEPHIPGVIAVFVFYGAVLALGIIATVIGRRKWKKEGAHIPEKDHIMLADRKMGVLVGIITLAGTAIGGGFIAGTVEYIFNPAYGLVWVQGPFFYQISIFLASFFAEKMKTLGHKTILDPFEIRFGQIHTVFLFLIFLLSSVLWGASNLMALGTSLSMIIGVNYIWAVLLSAAVAVLYTMLGGLYSVAYTDIMQLILVFIGVWLTLPFAWLNEAVTDITVMARSETSWLGHIEGLSIPVYIDLLFLISLGGVSWPEFFMRALALDVKPKGIIMVAGIAMIINLIVLVPCVLLGAIAASADWNATAYRDFGEIPVSSCDYSMGLPMVMRFLTPVPVGVIGLAALSAAVMSSVDSTFLGASTLLGNNIYTPIRNAISRLCCPPSKASDREIVWVMRSSIFLSGLACTVVAINANSIYGIYVLSTDLKFVAVFPQFVCAVFVPFTNIWGAVSGFWVTVLLRLFAGEPAFSLPPVIKYPLFDESTQTQVFPYRALITVIHFVIILGVSAIARAVFGPDNQKYLTAYAVNEMTQAEWSVSNNANGIGETVDEGTPVNEPKQKPNHDLHHRYVNKACIENEEIILHTDRL